MARVRIVTTRAPGLIPGLIREIGRSSRPVVLIPESFTLACETEIVNRSETGGIFDLQIFSPSSLVREVRELTGYGNRKPISGDGQNMIVSRLLHHFRDELKYYGDSAAQPALAAKIAGQIDDFTRARLTPSFLRQYRPASRRTGDKLEDLALVWDGYRQVLEKGFEDTVGQWMTAVRLLRKSGIVRNSRLLIYGFDYITHDLLNLVEAAVLPRDSDAAQEVVIGLVCDDAGPDREIFRAAADSVRALRRNLERRGVPCALLREEEMPPMDPGIAYAEKTICALGAFAGRDAGGRPSALREAAAADLAGAAVPDLSSVRVYFAKNSYLECQHACQTLISWRRAGVPWEEMAVAVCEQDTLPSLLPLTLSAAGIPFNAKQDRPMLMSGYAQYFLSLLRILRLNFCRDDVLRLVKTGFTFLSPEEVMDLENYARKYGIHRSRWLKPFHIPEEEKEKEKALQMEDLRQRLVDPIVELRKSLSRKGTSGRRAAALLFGFVADSGIYDRLLEQEDVLAAQGDDLTIDRNRQVWTAVNELLDTVATFIGDEPLPLPDLCAMLEASLSSRQIKSLPQLSGAVMVAPPQMFFSSGVPYMIVMGLQENELSPGAGILSEHERSQLEAFIEQANREADLLEASAPRPVGAPEDASAVAPAETLKPERPFSKIGQSLMDLAARRKQDVYQAVSLARRELMISASGAKPSGGVLTPSAAFRRLADTVRKTNPSNVTGSLSDPDLGPFAPAFALEALAVRLRETKDSEHGFLRGVTPEDARWRSALRALRESPDWKKKTESVLMGLRVAHPSGRISPEQASAIYCTHGMTVSRVEAFASCPWRHFLQYGLDLFPSETYAYRHDEQGAFHHDVLKLFLSRAMRHPDWPALSEETQAHILNQVLKESVRRWDGGILTSDTMHRYQGAGIIRGIRTFVASMMRAFSREGHFRPLAVEIPFGAPDETGKIPLPALQIPLPDGDTVAFTGRIDRIDSMVGKNGEKYQMITDMKMSPRDVRQNSVLAGLQLQLPLYIRAARAGLPGYQAAGGVYQPVRDVLVANEDPVAVRAWIDRELQPAGVVLDNETVLEAMQPLKASRQLDSNDTLSVVSADEMEALDNAALKTAADLIAGIRRGVVAPRPVKDGMTSPCDFCPHTDACVFDPTLPGCRVAEVDHKSRLPLIKAH